MKNALKRFLSACMVVIMLSGMLPITDVRVEAANVLTSSSFISNENHREYIDMMMRYYIDTNESLRTALTNGKSVVFMFEGGSDNYPGNQYSSHWTNYRNQAVSIVVKQVNGAHQIVFYDVNSSSLPGQPEDTNGNDYNNQTTIYDGIYPIKTTNHFGEYGALNVVVSKSYYTPPHNKDGQEALVDGINIHTRSGLRINGVGSSWGVWSAGCQLIGFGDDSSNSFNEFMRCVANIDYDVWTSYSGNQFGTIPYGVDVGYYVLDRQLATEGMKNMYTEKAISNITASSREAKEKALKTYRYIDEHYPTHGYLALTGDAVKIRNMPCSEATDSTVKVLEEGSTPDLSIKEELYEAVYLYRDNKGNLWYEVKLHDSDGTGYVYAGNTVFLEVIPESPIGGVSIPTTMDHGQAYPIYGTIQANYSKLQSVGAYVTKSGSLDILTGTKSLSVSSNYYELKGSDLDHSLVFNGLDIGNYILTVTADIVYYYAENGTDINNYSSDVSVCRSFAVVGAGCSHSYTSTVTAPTCESEGYTTYTCTKCGAQHDGDHTAPLGHSYSMATCYLPSTCTVCGETFREAKAHDYRGELIEATCSEREKVLFTCNDCGYFCEEYTTNLYSDWSESKPPYVSEDMIENKIQYSYRDILSSTEYTSWSDWSDSEYLSSSTREVRSRTVYRYINDRLADHNWIDNGITKYPTCCEEGMRKYVCADDHTHIYYETIPVNDDHVFADATCTAPMTCTVCGATSGSANGHSFKAATLTEPKTCTVCGITVGSPKSLTRIEIKKYPTKLLYIVGEPLDVQGGEVWFYYDDGTSEYIYLVPDMISGFDSSVIGEQTLTVTYEGKTASFKITVEEKGVIGFGIYRLPNKTEYCQYLSSVNTYGGQIYLSYNNGETEIIDMTDSMASGLDTSVSGKQSVTVNYEGYTALFEVEVLQLVSVSVMYPPNKCDYYIGDELDITGCVLEGVYSNGENAETELIPINDASKVKTSGFDGSASGTYDVNIEYHGFSASFLAYVSPLCFEGGNGTEQDPYQVATKEQLSYVRNYLDKHFVLVNDIEFDYADFWEDEGKFYNSGKLWIPIGSDPENAFTGTFDGNGYAVKYLEIGEPVANRIYSGLFGCVSGAVIKNLGIVDINMEIYPLKDLEYVSVFAGGLVGYAENVKIDNCYASGRISVMSSDDCEDYLIHAGGLVGSINYYYDGEINASVTNCKSSVTIAASGSPEEEKNTSGSPNPSTGDPSSVKVGGIVGNVSAELGGSVLIGSCSNDGTLIGESIYTFVGGIVGYGSFCETKATIFGCYNNGSVKSGANDRYPTFCGGIAGAGVLVGNESDFLITDCYNTGSVLSTISSNYTPSSFAGGIAGEVYCGAVKNCYNIGYVSADTYKGGIAGCLMDSVISNCYYGNYSNCARGVGHGDGTAVECTDEQMQQASTFAGFDFENVWTMDGEQSYLYPELIAKKVVSIELSELPYNLVYGQRTDGYQQLIIANGGKLTVTYSDGTIETVNLTPQMVSGFDITRAGTQVLTVTYGDAVTTFTVKVIADEETPLVTVCDVKQLAGREVSLNVVIKNNPGIVSATMRIHFDTSVMTLVSVKDAGVLGVTSHKPELASPYTLAWVNDTATENFTVNGTIVTLTFRISDGATLGDYPVDITFDTSNYDIYDKDGNPVEFTPVGGCISVIDSVIGDVNADGLVNNLDRMTLTRYLADWDGYRAEDIDTVAADVNCDGVVNNLDRMILTRHLADWDGYLSLPYAG